VGVGAKAAGGGGKGFIVGGGVDAGDVDVE
jgi:hypothetical protein